MNEETFDLNKNNKPEMMSLVLKWGLIILAFLYLTNNKKNEN